jgi:hypothetical protein
MESGTFHPKVTRHAWWRRALWALPGVFVFCCYTLTSYPIVRHLLVPWVRASRTTGLVVGATYASLLVAVLYCWLRLALGVAEPGWVPDAWLRRAAKGQISRRDYTYCHKCEAPRPLRAHHCGTAGRCVLAFDHRCPWTSCTVGWGNKPVFLQFLFWTTLFTGFCTWLSVYKTLVLGPVTMTGRFFPPCFRDKSYFTCFQEWAYDVQVQGTVLEERKHYACRLFLLLALSLQCQSFWCLCWLWPLQWGQWCWESIICSSPCAAATPSKTACPPTNSIWEVAARTSKHCSGHRC